MDILFDHLQVHLETLYYKFAPYHKNAGVTIRNGYRDPENCKKGVYLSNKPQTIPISKRKASLDPCKVSSVSPSHNPHIIHQFSNGCLPTYPQKSVLYRVSCLFHIFICFIIIVIFSLFNSLIMYKNNFSPMKVVYPGCFWLNRN